MGIFRVWIPKSKSKRRTTATSTGTGLRIERNREGILYFRQPKDNGGFTNWKIHPSGEEILRRAKVTAGQALPPGMFKTLHENGHLYTERGKTTTVTTQTAPRTAAEGSDSSPRPPKIHMVTKPSSGPGLVRGTARDRPLVPWAKHEPNKPRQQPRPMTSPQSRHSQRSPQPPQRTRPAPPQPGTGPTRVHPGWMKSVSAVGAERLTGQEARQGLEPEE